MSDPTIYVPSYSFSGWQATNPSKPLPAPQVDNELANVSFSLTETINALKDIRRSDGALKNGVVTVDSLSAGLTLGFTLKGGWTLGAHYIVGDGVFYGGKCYRCQVVNDATNATRPDVDTTTWLFLYSTTDLAGAMSIATYDPTGVGANVFARANHTGVQAISTITDLQTTLDSKADNSAVVTALAAKLDKTAVSFGQCRLTLSGGNLLLSRFGGVFLTIGGTPQTIPQAGVTLAATGLTPATLYYIYAYMNSGTMTLEASTTAPATDATTGIQIKTGDGSRSLVGMARTIAGPAWTDTATQRFVLSYYNRVRKIAQNGFSVSRTASSATFAEIHSEIRTEFLSWGDSAQLFNTDGCFYTSPGSGALYARLSLDGISDIIAETLEATAVNYTIPLTLAAPKSVSTGYHYATLAAQVSSGSGNFPGAAGNAGIHIFTTVEG